MALLLVVSMADCSSSVFFLPYMAHFPHMYLSAYYAGGSLSGLLPGLIVLGQVRLAVVCKLLEIGVRLDHGKG